MNDKNFVLSDDPKFQPSSDMTFSSMFEDEELYCRLVEAVIGEKIKLIEKPVAQVAYARAGQVNQERLNSVRVDVQATAENMITTLDLQKKFDFENILKRTIFYACRAYSQQSIPGNSDYKKLKPASITFVMSENETPNADGVDKNEIQSLSIGNTATGKFYKDTLKIHLVFVPTVIENRSETTDDLLIFSSFFAVEKQVQADEFARKFGETDLGGKIMSAYANALEMSARTFQEANLHYFTEKEFEMVCFEKDRKFEQQRLQAEQEKERIKAQAEQQILQAEQEKERIKAQAEQQILQAEQQNEMVCFEKDRKFEQQRLQAEQEKERIKAQAEQQILQAEQQKSQQLNLAVNTMLRNGVTIKEIEKTFSSTMELAEIQKIIQLTNREIYNEKQAAKSSGKGQTM